MTKEKLSQAKIAPGASQQWLTFPGTPVLYKWLKKPRTSHAIQLVVIEEKIDGVLRLSTEKERGVFYLPLLVIIQPGYYQWQQVVSKGGTYKKKIWILLYSFFANISEMHGFFPVKAIFTLYLIAFVPSQGHPTRI